MSVAIKVSGDLVKKTIADRVREKSVRRGGCMIWTGSKFSNGYAKAYLSAGSRGGKRRRRTMLVHREVYRSAHGGIPRDHLVVHSARCSGDHACVREQHLIAVRADKKMRPWVARRAR